MIRLRGLLDLSYQDYKKASMVLITSFCDFKCWKGQKENPCQNSKLMESPLIKVGTYEIVHRYMKNPLSRALVFSGLEPLFQKYEVIGVVNSLREETNDDIVIFTGYDLNEIDEKFITDLKQHKNIFLKVGRFIPDRFSIYDSTLGITLASDNQYGIQLS